MLPALGKIGLAPLLVEEIAGTLQPLLVGFAAFCAVLQGLVLIQAAGFKSLWRDVRGQLLLAVLLLAASYFAAGMGLLDLARWMMFSYLVIGLCGLMLVLQDPPRAVLARQPRAA